MRLGRFICTLSAVICLSISAQARRAGEKYVKNEVLVKLAATDASSARAAFGAAGSDVVERFADLGWLRIKLPAGMSVNDAIKRFSSVRGVEAVQPNYYYKLAATPNDPRFSDPAMYGLDKISAPQAWDLTTGSATVVVANIDTGVRHTHEDLAANMWTNPGEINNNGIDDDSNGFIDDFYGYDFFFGDGDPIDENGHGTHTAGTIGAVGNNGIGVAGVSWNVRIMAIKIYDADGRGTTAAMLINAYNYIRMMKNRGVNIRVTNNSYGGCDEACGYDQATRDAIDAMGDAGILNVFAAHNENRNIDLTPTYPAAYTSPSIISVANSTTNDERHVASNYGVVSVDLAAPGSGILSTGAASDSDYRVLTGTSMAAPHVTGVAALLAAYNPSLSAASIKATILNNVDALPSWSGVVKTGGRLNALKALQNQTVCTFNLSSTNISVGTKGGYYSFDVNAPQNCDFALRSNVNWIKFSGHADRSGTGTVTVRVSLTPALNRSGTISAGGQTVTVTQARGGIF